MGKAPPPAYMISVEPDPPPDYHAAERLRDTLHLYCDLYRDALRVPREVPFPSEDGTFFFLAEIERVAAFGRRIVEESDRMLDEDDFFECPICRQQFAGGIGRCLDCNPL